MSEAYQKPNRQNPEGYSPKLKPEILSLAEDARQIEKPVQTINYKGAEFEVVRRPDVIWVGSVDYAANNTDESDSGETLKRFQGLVETAPIKEKVNPDWSAALSVNYTRSDKPCGIMFANESYTDRQDGRYDIFTQPGGLWLRVKGDDPNAKTLLGKEKAPLYEFFEPLRNAAKENGYVQNPDVPVEIEYHCHAEYSTPPHTCYAYIPVIESPEGYSPKQKPEILKMMEQKFMSASEKEQDIASGGEPPRLSDIRPLLDGMKGHNYALPDCIKFILERVGGHKDLYFWNIAALTGDTVAQVYDHNPAAGREYCVSGYLSGPEHIAHIFDALGYDREYVTAKQFNSDTAYYLRKIAAYISNGVPVLVKTNLNDIPAWKSDVGTHCLIVGYHPEKNTLELLVSGTEPIEYEMTGENKLDLIFIGEKRREVSREEVYRNIVKKMAYWLTLPERDGLYFGSAAYRAWADDIEQGRFAEEGFPLWENYGVYVCNLATNGDFAMFHLRELAEMNPRYSDLSHLNAEILKLTPTEKPDGNGKNLLWIQLDELGGGMDMDAVRETMRDKEKRSKVAAALRDYAKRLDQAVGLLLEQIPEGYSPKEKPEI